MDNLTTCCSRTATLLCFLAVFTATSPAYAQIVSFFSETGFDNYVGSSCPDCSVVVEGFEGYGNGAPLPQINYSNTTITLSPLIQVFYGSWGLFSGCQASFSGGSMLATSTYNSLPAVLTFSEPVYAFGGVFYDDGAPAGVISLTVTTAKNNTQTINETCNSTGDTGFMGFASPEGIKQIIFTIDFGAVELDRMRIAQRPDCTSATAFSSDTAFSNYIGSNCFNCLVETEDFAGYAASSPVNQVAFSETKVTFAPNDPVIFYGGWSSFPGCLPNKFQGAGLLPIPSFATTPLTFVFSPPVSGFGADVFDDGDGTPAANQITMTVVTTQNDTLYLNETCNQTGYTGFMGAYSPEGIARVTFSIDGSGGNLEIDNIVVANASSLCGGTIDIIRSDSSWKSTDSFEPGWNQPGFDDSGWSGATQGSMCGLPANECAWDAEAAWNAGATAASYFRKNFTLADAASVVSATLRSFANDDHAVYLNGNLVHQDTGNDPGEILQSNIAAFLLTGANVIAVSAGAPNGCRSFLLEATLVSDSVSFGLDSIATTQSSCGSPTGTITINDDTESGLQFSIDGTTFQSNKQYSNLAGGTYQLTVKNTLGCQDMIAVTVPATQPPQIANIAVVSTGCSSPNGALTVAAGGGMPPLQYALNGGAYQSSNVFGGLAGGTYTVTTQDANGCTASQIATVLQTPPPQITNITAANTGCSSPIAALTVTAGGGTGALQYALNGGAYQSSNVFGGLTTGTYTVTTQDANGCTASQIATVQQTPSPQITNIAVVQTACSNPSGALTISAGGGTGALQYALNGGIYQSSNVFGGLAIGTYTVTVQDANGCTAVQTAMVQTTPLPQVTNIAVVHTSCGNANGSLTIAASGGTGALQYALNGGPFQGNNGFGGLVGGAYSVTVQDANGCKASQNTTIQASQSPQITNVAVVHTTCGNANGSLNVGAGSGTPPLQYALNGGTFQGGNVFSGLAAGAYFVTIRDAIGCTAVQTATIQPSQPPQITNVAVVHTTCGNPNGALTISAGSGTAPLQYALNGGTYQAGNMFGGLAAGTYTVTIRDAIGCTAVQTAAIQPSQPPQITNIAVVHTTCGNPNGSLTVSAGSGTAPLQFALNGGAYLAGNVFGGLAGGTYTVTTRDAVGCTATQTAMVQASQLPQISNVAVVHTSCGNADGSLTVSAGGGVGALQYSLNGGAYQAGNVFSGLPGGTFTVGIQDANGCTNTQNATVQSSLSPQIANVAVVHTTCGFANGMLSVSAGSGVAPLQYALNGGAYQSNNVFAGLASGTYSVTVLDALGCTVSQGATVLPSQSPVISGLLVEDATCDKDNGALTVSASGGTGLLQYSINGAAFQPANIFEHLAGGDYTVTVQDALGCTATDNRSVQQWGKPAVLDAVGTTASCGNFDGTISVTASGGLGVLTYSAIPGLVFPSGSLDSLPSGTYSVTVTDEAGCTAVSKSVKVAENCDIYIPNVFSPNLDGVNDQFGAYVYPGFKGTVAEFLIFDRWGGLLFQKGNLPVESDTYWWDGTLHGDILPVGVYVYFLRIVVDNSREEIVKTGSVLLTR